MGVEFIILGAHFNFQAFAAIVECLVVFLYFVMSCSWCMETAKERTNYIFRVTLWIAWMLKWLGNVEEFCSIAAMAGREIGLVLS